MLLFALLLLMNPDGPMRQPQAAAAQGQVAITYGGPGAIYFAASPDGGRTFAAPTKVADTPVLALGRHRGPRLAITPAALVITAVAGEAKDAGPHAHGLPADGNLLAWRSTDHGRTWALAATINDEPSSAREGLHAMAGAPDGRLFAVWLDLRAKGTKLYGAQSKDGGKSWSKNVLVYESPSGTICQCCHPSARFDDHGNLWVMWRNVVDGARDLYVARSRDGVHFEPAAKQGEDTWKLDACPMDGGGFYIENGKVTSAWRRKSEIYLERPGQPEHLVAEGKDTAIARSPQGPVIAWTTPTGGIAVLEPGAKQPKLLSPQGAFVNLTALPGGHVLAAWETPQGIETRRLEPHQNRE